MKKITILSLMLATFLMACSSTSKEKALIKGHLKNFDTKSTIYLDQLEPLKVSIIDSAKTDAKGNFSMSYDVPHTGYYRLRIGKNQTLTFIFTPNDHVTLDGDATDIIKTAAIKGSKVNLKLLDYNRFIKANYLKRDSINKLYESMVSSPKLDSIQTALKKVYEGFYSQMEDKAVSIINEDPGSFLALAAIQQLSKDKYTKLFEKVDSAFGKAHPKSPYFKPFDDKVSEMKKLSPGSIIPDIILPDTSGKTRKLSDLRGHVVLVDFWASWCHPCRMENPNVVAAYKKFHSKGFEVFSVSLDGLRSQKNPKADWEKAINHDGLIWPNQVSALKGWQSPVVQLFGIKGIPYNFLIDKNGKIIAKDLRGQALQDKLAQVFGE